MSDGNQPQPAEPPVEPWHPALRALLFLVGFVLLLPGLCTVVLVFLLETNPLASPGWRSGCFAWPFRSAAFCSFVRLGATDRPESRFISVV
jgi:hypothetical protein